MPVVAIVAVSALAVVIVVAVAVAAVVTVERNSKRGHGTSDGCWWQRSRKILPLSLKS